MSITRRDADPPSSGATPWATALLFAGAVLLGVSFAALRWYSVAGGADTAGDGFTFADLHHDADQLGAPVATAYFDRLAWGLVGIVVLLGIAAKLPALPVAASGTLRVLGFLAGFLGAAMTYYALKQLFDAQRAAGGSGHHVLHNASWGLWSAFAGFALAALGAAVGPPRSATIRP